MGMGRGVTRPSDPPVSVASELLALRQRVDEETARLEDRHRARLRCAKGCCDCCVDDLSVFEVEAERIRALHPAVLRSAPAPEGGCAFLDGEGACRIYESRPHVCRTQGLPLRWIDWEEEVEARSICPLNEEGPSLVELPAEDCLELGPNEAQLATLEARRSGVAMGSSLARVRLRDLFEGSGQ